MHSQKVHNACDGLNSNYLHMQCLSVWFCFLFLNTFLGTVSETLSEIKTEKRKLFLSSNQALAKCTNLLSDKAAYPPTIAVKSLCMMNLIGGDIQSHCISHLFVFNPHNFVEE